jgi:hypothetical protein
MHLCSACNGELGVYSRLSPLALLPDKDKFIVKVLMENAELIGEATFSPFTP